MANAPLWLIALVLLAALIGARELGFWLRWRTRRGGEPTSHDGEGHVLSAALGLLALLIGFTFALALSRYDLRRELVLQEANAIAAVYHYAELADEADRANVQGLVRAYVDARLRYAEQQPDASNLAAAYRETEIEQAKLAKAVTAAAKPRRDTSLGTAFVSGLNHMLDAAAARKAALEAQVPARVTAMLVLFALIAEGILGYVLGDPKNPQRAVGMVHSVLLTLALVLVIDLDRPWSGGITVSQQPMVDLQASLRAPP